MDQIVFWHWWIVAALLLIGEMLTLTTYLFWIALAAAVTGLIKWFAPSLSWEWQFVLFAIFSILAVVLWWRYQKSRPLSEKQQLLNRRAEQHIGRQLNLVTAIENGNGKALVDDTQWMVRCEQDLPAGSKVKVVAVDGNVLAVIAIS